jgi:signal transduction histidine kinase
LLTGDLKEQQRVFAIADEMDRERARLTVDTKALQNEVDNYVSTLVHDMSVDRTEPGVALTRFEDDLMRVRTPLNLAFDQIVSHERGLLDASRSSQRLARGAQWALAIAAVLGVLLTIGSTLAVAYLIRRHSERTRAAETVAERASTSRKDLLAASTDLSAPLQKIMSEAAQLRAATTNEQQSRILTSIASSASRVDRFLRQLLDVTAVEAGTMALRQERCDVAALVDRAIERQRESAYERGIRLQFEVRLSLTVSADPERIGEVLTSLLAHAVTSTRIGATIVVTAVPSEDGVRFAVTDGGVSVQPAVAAPTNDLALHLAQRVIEAHGGRLGIDAATAGRTYWFTLPTEPRVLR